MREEPARMTSPSFQVLFPGYAAKTGTSPSCYSAKLSARGSLMDDLMLFRVKHTR